MSAPPLANSASVAAASLILIAVWSFFFLEISVDWNDQSLTKSSARYPGTPFRSESTRWKDRSNRLISFHCLIFDCCQTAVSVGNWLLLRRITCREIKLKASISNPPGPSYQWNHRLLWNSQRLFKITAGMLILAKSVTCDAFISILT